MFLKRKVRRLCEAVSQETLRSGNECAGLKSGTSHPQNAWSLRGENICYGASDICAKIQDTTNDQPPLPRSKSDIKSVFHFKTLKLPFFGTFVKSIQMGKNTSISLGNHFENFIESSVNHGRYNNASEVVRAGLRLLEEQENKILALRKAIHDGIDSGVSKDFDPNKLLVSLKARKRNGNI